MKKVFLFILACVGVIWVEFSKDDDSSDEFEKWLDEK